MPARQRPAFILAVIPAVLPAVGLAVSLLIPVTLLAGSASAQDALGSGHALDRNLDPRFRGVNPDHAGQDFRQRNLLITDDVIGGRGFRESVGYTSERSFRDDLLGSNDLYAFRRDSALSDVNFLNYGNTYQRFRYGQSMGLVEYQRSGTGTDFSSLDEAQLRPSERIEAQLRIDRFTAASNLTSLAVGSSEPTSIGGFRSEEGSHRIMHVSSLTGLGDTAIEQMGQIVGITSFDSARAIDDVMQGRTSKLEIGREFKTLYADLPPIEELLSAAARREAAGAELLAGLGGGAGGVAGGGAGGDARGDAGRGGPGANGAAGGLAGANNRSGADRTGSANRGASRPGAVRTGSDPDLSRSPYSRIQERIAERFSMAPPGVTVGEPADLTELDEGMSDLREWLRSVTIDPRQPGLPIDPDARFLQQNEADGVIPDDMVPADVETVTGFRRDGSTVDDEEDQGGSGQETETPVTTTPIPIEDFGLILRHGQRVDRLAQDDETRFNELVAAGEKLLREGEYFWAERRFIRALRFTPGHPLATAGLAHAQIGAGLYVSAALTLRSLYVYQPEMIDARFSPGLIPNRPRLLRAVETLRDRLGRQAERDSDAFLFAYVGRLLGEREVVEQGLEEMAKAAPNDPLVQLLREVWLRTDEPVGAGKRERSETPENSTPPDTPDPGE